MDKKLKFILCISVFLLLSLSSLADIEQTIREAEELLKESEEEEAQETLENVYELIKEGKEQEAREKLQTAYPDNNEGTHKFNDKYLDYLQNQHLDLEAFNLLSGVRQETTSVGMENKNKVLENKLHYIEERLKWVEQDEVSDAQKQRIDNFRVNIQSKRDDAA